MKVILFEFRNYPGDRVLSELYCFISLPNADVKIEAFRHTFVVSC
jgi:hypothetical protein